MGARTLVECGAVRIGMVLNNTFPPDIRVEKEVSALGGAGHHVHLLAYAPSRAADAVVHPERGLRVEYVPSVYTGLSRLRRRWNRLRYLFSFMDRYWEAWIERTVRDHRLDALHVHDLPLVRTAVRVGRRAGIPVVADLHENYPATLRILRAHSPDFLERVTIRPRWWDRYERAAIRDADHVVVVVDEAKRRLLRSSGVSAEKITVVMNVEPPDAPDATPDPQIREALADGFTMGYVGGGGVHRGLDTAVRAVGHLTADIPNAKLLIVGPNESDAASLRALAADCGVEDAVRIVGWRPFSDVFGYISAADVCLVPHHRSPHTDSTIPHKLFQYMLAGKPVIVSDCRPLHRIVTETGSGLVFRSGDAEALARRVCELHGDDDARRECGRRGRRAVMERYNWHLEGEKLVSLYRKLMDRRARAGR